jgi:crossover junction endodeoxyribonuclease RuvC
MRILGIDPGLCNTGFGVIEIKENKPHYVASGIIHTNANESLSLRLKDIVTGINEIIITTKPNCASVEKVFVNVNPQSTLLLGQARGAAITALVINNLDVFEYTALQVKQAVVGYGHAEKEQIMKMVKYSLHLKGVIKADAADALAVALTHFYSKNILQTYNISNKKNGRLMS